MARRIREHLRRNVVGYVALFFTLSMGTAYATHPGGADTISSADIINDNVNSADVRNDTLANGGLQAVDLRPDSVGSSELAPDSVATSEIVEDGIQQEDLDAFSVGSPQIASGAVRSSEVANGTVGSIDLAPSALGARAYGRVSSGGSLTRSKNVASVNSPAAPPGIFCITLGGGIDPASAVLVPAPDQSGNETIPPLDDVSVVEWDSSGDSCSSGTLEVDTFVYRGDGTDDDDGGGNTIGDNLEENYEAFVFVVP